MKKIRKIVAVAALAAMALSLTSCVALDNIKEHRMNYSEDGEKIEFGGKTYVSSGYTKNKLTSFVSEYEEYRVAEKEVPLLLSYHYGHRLSYDKNIDVIIDGDTYYCTEDRRADLLKMLNDSVIDTVCVEEYNESDKKFSLVALPESMSGAIFDAIDGEPLDETDALLVRQSGSYYCQIFLTSKDKLVMSPDGDSYYIVSSGTKIYIACDMEGTLYAVPDEKEQEVKEFFSQRASGMFGIFPDDTDIEIIY